MKQVDKSKTLNLLVISRGRFSLRNNEFLFQTGDGYYLDQISAHFAVTTIVAQEIPEKNITNETYSFKNKVQFINRTKFSGKKLFLKFRTIHKLIKTHDVVYLFYPLKFSLFIALITAFMGKKVIAYNGGFWSEFKTLGIKNKFRKTIMSYYYNLLESLSIRLCNVYLSNNNSLLKKHAKKQKVKKSYPLLKFTEKDLHYSKTSVITKKLKLLSVNHIKPGKGLFELVTAISLLKKSTDLDIELTIIGSYTALPDFSNALKKHIKNLELDDTIKLLGQINDHPTILSYYKSSDIFIIASESEGFPRVIWESFSQSLPVISTALPNILMEFENKSLPLLCIPNNSPENIVNGITVLANDLKKRNELIDEGMNCLKDRIINSPVNQFYEITNTI